MYIWNKEHGIAKIAERRILEAEFKLVNFLYKIKRRKLLKACWARWASMCMRLYEYVCLTEDIVHVINPTDNSDMFIYTSFVC